MSIRVDQVEFLVGRDAALDHLEPPGDAGGPEHFEGPTHPVGVFGMGEKLFAVPWTSLTVDGENKQLLLNVSKERLKDAPGFDKDHWPNFADPAFTQQINAYYG